ncbi:F-box protein CPR1-like [Mercurialis annua]|uniref:F-box protein CPR1-like n=1 Tax=Mercurialis annua TaxID=3986 RepID=UPI00216082D2|nr:F-box protein CPR1-like [Mercurialis annua]
MSEELHVDIMFDILTLLPIKSILRFRCLSKYYCGLIDGPDFINYHLNLTKSKSNGLLIFNEVHQDGSIYQLDLDSRFRRTLKLEMQRVPFLKHSCDSNVLYGDMFGSCNGLVAMYNHQGITLWNPSTKSQQLVRKFWTGDIRFDGFGYDAAANDYKVVIITKEDSETLFRVMIYSLKDNSSTRIQDLETPSPNYDKYYNNLMSVFVGSSLHWVVIPREEPMSVYHNILLAFDLRNRQFNEVLQPTIADEGIKFMNMVVELKGCLCTSYAYNNRADIWIMKEYGVRESWTKLFSMGYNVYMELKPLLYVKSDRILVEAVQGITHSWLDPTSHTTEILYPFGKSGRRHRVGILCARSLVPLPHKIHAGNYYWYSVLF